MTPQDHTIRTDDGDAMWAPHRRPTFPVDAPIFTRHIVIRVDDDMAPYLSDNDDDYNARRQRLIDAINEHIARIQGPAKYRPRFVADQTAGRAMKAGPDGFSPIEFTDTLFFRVDVEKSVDLGVRVDAHNEYLTVTFLADCLRRAGDGFEPIEPVAKVLNLLDRLSGGDTAESCEADIELMYEGFWTGLSAIMERAGRPIEPALGVQLSDIRGFVSCAPDVAQPMSERHKGKLLELRSSRLQDRLDKKIDYDVFHFIKRRPNFFGNLLGFARSDPSETNSPANVPISGVLDGAAIYGSTLRPVSAHSFTPLRYFIIYNDNSQSQIARLIRRLHVLAELRIAALMDMKGLRAANRRIRNLSREIDKLSVGQLDGGVLSSLNADYVIADKGPTTADRNAKATQDEVCRGGTTYRVERSRYYAKAYTERLQDLRIVRIEGWQPYDAFMRRNLFMEFDYISQIGDRFAAVGRRIERLGAIVQINAFRAYNESIANSGKLTAGNVLLVAEQTKLLHLLSRQSSEDVKQLRNLADNISDAQDELLGLQAIAEPVGWGAFSYYVGSSLSKLAIGLIAMRHWMDIAPESATADLVEAGCIAAAAVFYVMVVRPLVASSLRAKRQDELARRNAERNGDPGAAATTPLPPSDEPR